MNIGTVSPTMFRRAMSLWPPMLFSGITITSVSDDWTQVRVRLRVRRWNANMNGSAFGGSLSAMVDPFFAIMAVRQLGPEYVAANAEASITFVAPGHGDLISSMSLTRDEALDIRRQADALRSSRTTHETRIESASGDLVALCSQQLHVRRR